MVVAAAGRPATGTEPEYHSGETVGTLHDEPRNGSGEDIAVVGVSAPTPGVRKHVACELVCMPMPSRRRLLSLAGLALVAVAVVVGLSQAPKTDTSPKRTAFSLAQAQKDLAGSPAPLAALHAQSAQLLDGGKSDVTGRLKALRGTPVVVNKWASWCGPCRAEFPFFQQAGVTYGKQIAFVGLNSGDNTGDATSFLKRFPVPYPSYQDPRERVAAALGASTAYPITIFFDASGKQVYLHQGGYPTQAKLDEDLQRYLKPAR
jgi:cytochrome c biogenesis protein CcmG/thiol:disulfide interchange protein DsbE